MLALALVLALGQATGHGRAGGPIVSQPNTMGAFAAFEFAPANGRGMGTACAGTIPTGVRGEVPTFTRASAATCLKSASTTTGISPGDMVDLSNNQPRVMYGLAAVNFILGVLFEKPTTQDVLQTEAFDNAAYTSTATVGANTAPINSPKNTATGDLLTDASGAAFQGSCQTVSTTSATVHSASVFVVAGTANSAQITMTGTGSAAGDCSATLTGLSSSTWTRLWCTGGGSPYAGTLTAVTICVNVGNTSAVTGTLGVWGMNHEVNRNFATSYVAATTVAVTRAIDSQLLFSTLPSGMLSAGSVAVTFIPGWSSAGLPVNAFGAIIFDNNGQPLEDTNGNAIRMFDGTTEPIRGTTYTAGAATRLYSFWGGGSMTVSDTALTTAGAFDGTMGATTQIQIGARSGGGNPVDGVLKLVCLDPVQTRCR